jgi:hypothetical protein
VARKETSKFDAPKLDPMALPSVCMEARLQQVHASASIFAT